MYINSYFKQTKKKKKNVYYITYIKNNNIIIIEIKCVFNENPSKYK